MLPDSRPDEEGAKDAAWEHKLYKALKSVQPPGTYAVSAVCAKDLGGKRLMTITGVGALSLPINEEQGAALLAAGEQKVSLHLATPLVKPIHSPCCHTSLACIIRGRR
jgi:hypothetical protein